MKRSKIPGLARRVHRWLSVAFTLAALANVVALITQSQAVWLGFLSVVPLVLLVITGLYLFALPYVARRRDERRAPGGLRAQGTRTSA